MKRTALVFRVHLKDISSWLYVPWAILLGTFLVNMLAYTLTYQDTEPGSSGGILPYLVYMFIYGIVVVQQTFLFALGMGISRRDYFWGTIAMATCISLLSAVAFVLLAGLERQLDGWGGLFYFFNLISFDPKHMVLFQVWFYAVISLLLFSCGFLVSILYRRIGKVKATVILIIISILLSLFISLAFSYEWWGHIARFFSGWTVVHLTNAIAVLTLALILLARLLIRRATV